VTANQEFCYSTNEQDFSGGEWNRQQAAERASEEVEGHLLDGESKTVWTGECDPVSVLDLASGLDVRVLEFLDDAIYELVKDGADSFSDHVSDEAEASLRAKLNALMVQWAREFDVNPKVWTVECIEEHEVRRGVGDDGDTIYLDGEALT
jgi:hypothetical protein